MVGFGVDTSMGTSRTVVKVFATKFTWKVHENSVADILVERSSCQQSLVSRCFR